MAEDLRKKLLNQLFMLIKTAQIHDPANRAFSHPLELFRQLLEVLMEEEGALSLESVDVGLYLNENKIRTDISTFSTVKYLDEVFKNKNIGGLRILQVPSPEELTSFLRLLVRSSDSTQLGADTLNEQLVASGIASIELLPRVERKSVAQHEVKSVLTNKKRALKNYVKAIDIMKKSTAPGNTQFALDARKAKRVIYDLVDICMDEGFSFFGLSSIKNYDEYTFNHSVNVSILSIGFGKNLGLSKKQVGELGIAGLYHDYGKVSIPRSILNKPGKFDAGEWEIMKTHPILSIKQLLQVKGGFQDTDIKKMIAAFEHHRNYDCTGYPQTGVKKDLNFYSRVVAIADAYDAMTTNRVYQRGMLPTVALKILQDNAGTKFDPLLVKAFVNTIGIFPVGSLVRLNTGVMAIVASVHSNSDKLAFPVVKVVADPKGNPIENGPQLDLANQPGGEMSLVVEEVLRPEEFNINVAHHLFGDALTPSA